ncbi:MAG TPA: helix-turn-helix domain-containing protein [Candidatus Nanoarchaeia archaeon]|nr:helix-turn-helix domain-containing protein [Candidatus Nanoarchaeia archaeon]
MDTSVLEDLGLTGSEIKVYLSLLELGASTAGPIRDKTSLQNSVVHRALLSLINKGLISFILEAKRKLYQATEPEHFYDYIENKKQRFDQLLPELKSKQKRATHHEQASVYKGTRGIAEVYNTLLNSGAKEYLSFGGGKQCEERMGTFWWENLHTKRIKNKIKSRQVFDETVRLFGSALVKRPLSQVRYLGKEFAQFQETVIVGEYVAISVFTEKCYSFLLKDKLVADGYKKHFELLWKSAKE